MTLNDIKDLVKADLKINMTITQIRRAKLMTIATLEGDLKEEYARLWDYLEEIKRSNPGSTTDMKVSRPTPTELLVFERLYISFNCLKKGLLGGCRKVLGLDGCFLKGKVKGELLAAVGRDGNNQMFPVAWAVVNTKNKANWRWFIGLLKSDLNLDARDGWTMIKDQQKVFFLALLLLFLNCYNNWCCFDNCS